MPALTLLRGVTWQGTPVPGVRPAALLAALALQPAGVSDEQLVDHVWGDDVPAHPSKALQVLVSRLRSSYDPSLVTRTAHGYRLGLPTEDVDAWQLQALARTAAQALGDGRPDAAVAASEDALLLAPDTTGDDDGPLGDLRADARATLSGVRRTRALAVAAAGSPTAALPLLVAEHEGRPDDQEVLVGLLRAEALATGTPSALARYEGYRRDLADRLGVDPDPALQRVHRELLAADAPVRTGVREDADQLVGREDDLVRLRSAVRTGRLTTILGPGGIGKTRLAHVIAREAPQPRVHLVELVGVASGDDLVAEVGASLGVRGSITARTALTPAQQADVRGRIAQELDSGPTLLVLDNCEHLLETVATLVAFLLATTRDLTVLTTSRAPLRIAAERVVPVTQLAGRDAGDLFARRAHAVRPDAELVPDDVHAIVERLDGLPLAVELAAARVRTMAVAEVRRRLDDRFGLLRGGDRTAPERHRTLEAVIGWSWDLLEPDEQSALATLSVFQDGVSPGAADAVLGREGAVLVEALVDQSLLVVGEVDGQVRYRMLETVREFGAERLRERDAVETAYSSQDRWAVALCDAHRDLMVSDAQVEGVDVLLREENNLTDVLRRALARGDAPVVATLVSALGSLWTITGDHARLFAIADGAEQVLVGWDPPAEHLRTAQEAASMLLIQQSWLPGHGLEALAGTLRRWGPAEGGWAQAAHAMFVAPGEPIDDLVALADEQDDPAHAGMLMMWASLAAENLGEVARARDLAGDALQRPGLTPFLRGSLHAQLVQLLIAEGDHALAARHAEAAWPLLASLRAYDDARSIRIGMAVAPMIEGDFERAARILDEVELHQEGAQIGSRMVLLAARAELALARGEVREGLRRFDQAVELTVEESRHIPGLSPWVLIATAGALVARVHHDSGEQDAERARELCRVLCDSAAVGRDGQPLFADYPLNGLWTVALGAWALRWGGDDVVDDALRLLSIGNRWAYNRSLPTMAWAPLVALAEGRAKGRLDLLLEQDAGRPSTALVPDALAAYARVAAAATSSG